MHPAAFKKTCIHTYTWIVHKCQLLRRQAALCALQAPLDQLMPEDPFAAQDLQAASPQVCTSPPSCIPTSPTPTAAAARAAEELVHLGRCMTG